MSTLYLIRHGQASFGAPDYDVLSPTGVDQSRELGAYLAARLAIRALTLDAVYTGPRRRHLDTTRHLRDGAAGAGHGLPDPVVIHELDEYPAFELLARWMPALAQSDPELGGLLEPGGGATPARGARAFEVLLARWARGELDTGELETFTAFSARVRRGLARIMEREGRQRSVAVVTSGGPISIAVQMALEISDERTIKIAWVLANASITELRWRGAGELGLVSLNAIPHLSDPALITYR